MTLDPSIHNVNECFSSHYLDSTFPKDIRERSRRWSEEGANGVPRRLQREARHYLRAKEEALDVERPGERWNAGRHVPGWHARLLEALGYTDRRPVDLPVEGGKAFVPALGRVHRHGKLWLAICETVFCLPDGSLREGMPSESPLEMAPLPGQLVDGERKLCEGDWKRAVGRVFTEEGAPRWLLLLAGSQVLLLDRRRFSQGRWLRFDLDELFGRRERSAFDQVAAFLSAGTLCPGGESDEVLHDRLEERSHRFAHGVTDRLQAAVREAIEILGNEWVEDRRRRGLSYTKRLPAEPLPDGTTEVTAEHLRREALVLVYRLLFCFYAEARGGELGLLPIDEECYRLGYSLESLRDLEQVQLTEASSAGSYFHEHLKRLFRLIHRGFDPRGPRDFIQTGTVRAFAMRPLTATLFDPKETPLLSGANLSNRCLQRVIRRLSLSVDEKTRSIGRVNYAELGINQLGAVYEGLLSYRGMFADRDLIHVKPAGKELGDKKTPTWFVPRERLEEFERDEVERLEGGKPRVYPRGSFILHLSGIEREQSASYYTPEVLTRCVVEESLRELLADLAPGDADRILELKICEPAMGSGAFLNEATGRLAARYLELKQKQLGETIDPVEYPDELRRAKHYIATRNAYGVDLNPMAVELGSLSLWLGSIHRLRVKRGEGGEPDRHQPGATPWFGLRLRCGNSLIGARRVVWTAEQLRKGEHAGKDSTAPRLLGPGEPRGEGEVYHFLVLDEEMAPAARDKLMRQFWPERCATAKRWVSKEVKPKWRDEQIEEALGISDLVDEHWRAYSEQRAEALEKTACTATVWPAPPDSDAALAPGPSLEEQERIEAELEATSGSFQRLKLLMDGWCALWFWPLERVDVLPGREAWLASARLLLGHRRFEPGLRSILSASLGFDVEGLLAAAEAERPDTDAVAAAVAWYDVTREIAAASPFHHWELVFPEVLGEASERRGFDLVVGNPPWILVTWAEPAVLSEFDALLGVREAKSATFNARRQALLEAPEVRSCYADEFRKNEGQVAALNSPRSYGELAGMKANLYKNFIVRSWSVVGKEGVVGLLHPEGPYNDAKGGSFRREVFTRLRAHYQFENELNLFVGTNDHGRLRFSINVYSGDNAGCVSFRDMSNVFAPKTIWVQDFLSQRHGARNIHREDDLRQQGFVGA